MKITQIVFILMLLMPVQSLLSQQAPLMNHSYINPFLLNPSYIGMQDYTQGFLISRRQWTGIQGAPETNLFSTDGALTDKIGLGFMIANDVTDIIGKTGAYAAYRYMFEPTKGHLLRFGLAAGILQNRIFFDRIIADDITDAALFETTESRMNFDANVGISYSYNRLELGFATLQLFNTKYSYINQNKDQSLTYQLIRHFNAHVKYSQEINEFWAIEPNIVLRTAQGMPLESEVAVYAKFKDQFWGGLSYQNNFGIGINIGGVLYKQIVAGYSYNVSSGSMYGYNNGTHEIVLGVRLYKQGKTPVNKSEFSREDFNHLVRVTQEQYEQIEELKSEVSKTQEDVLENKEEIKRLRDIFDRDKDSIYVAVNRYGINLEDLDEEKVKQLYEKNKDNDILFLVLGAYLNIEDAKFFQKILIREIGLETKVKASEQGNYFFVYTKSYTANGDLKKDIERELRLLKTLNISKYINGNVWIYNAETPINE